MTDVKARSRLSLDPSDLAAGIVEVLEHRPQRPPYVMALANAFLLAADKSLDEEVLHLLLCRACDAFDLEVDAVLHEAAGWLETTGLIVREDGTLDTISMGEGAAVK